MMHFKKLLVSILCISLLVCSVSCANGNSTINDSEMNSSEESSRIPNSSSDSSVNDVTNGNGNSSDDNTTGEGFSSEDSTGSSTEDTSDTISSSESLDSVDSNDSQDITSGGENRFSPISPSVDFNKVWEKGKMELFNTDFRMSEELEKKFEKQFASFTKAQSVALIELDTNMAFTYSKDTKIATASSIKGPMGLFAYKCIDDGLISWDTMKSYQVWHYQANSTGVVQNSPFGTAFNVKTLMDYMIRISDNQAYLMIKELVGAGEFEKMMESLGSTQIIPTGSNWGYITGWEMATVWREIYHYSLASDSGAELFDRFMHAQYNYIYRAIPQYEAAHKSGWSGKAFNDAGVVFADGHQYVLVVLMGRNGVKDPSSQYQFNNVTRLLAELMVEYNAYLDAGSDLVSSEKSGVE